VISGGLAERVHANSIVPCRISSGGTIRDSVCDGVFAGFSMDTNAGGTNGAKLFNVTATGDTYGLQVLAGSDPTRTAQLTAVNTIASGGTSDVRVTEGDGAQASASLTSSNFDEVSVAGGATSSLPSENANQDAAVDPPQFVDAAGGDFHQLETSPTIDAGTAVGGLGAFDIDGVPRTLGTAPDIGADEFGTVPVDPAPVDTVGPETSLTKGPKRKLKTAKRKVRLAFEFEAVDAAPPAATPAGVARYECNLDGKGWKACTSPYRVKVKAKRKAKSHRFEVAAIDGAGNRDATPATHTFKVRRR
jgi:hypothetical protein